MDACSRDMATPWVRPETLKHHRLHRIAAAISAPIFSRVGVPSAASRLRQARNVAMVSPMTGSFCLAASPCTGTIICCSPRLCPSVRAPCQPFTESEPTDRGIQRCPATAMPCSRSARAAARWKEPADVEATSRGVVTGAGNPVAQTAACSLAQGPVAPEVGRVTLTLEEGFAGDHEGAFQPAGSGRDKGSLKRECRTRFRRMAQSSASAVTSQSGSRTR